VNTLTCSLKPSRSITSTY